MAFLGVFFFTFGVLGEAILGTRFEEFFNLAYPHGADRWNDYRLKVRLSRLMLCLGVVLLVLSGVRQLIA